MNLTHTLIYLSNNSTSPNSVYTDNIGVSVGVQSLACLCGGGLLCCIEVYIPGLCPFVFRGDGDGVGGSYDFFELVLESKFWGIRCSEFSRVGVVYGYCCVWLVEIWVATVIKNMRLR